MKERKQIMITALAIAACGFVIVILMHFVLDMTVYDQRRLESDLPEILQVETKDNPTIRVLIKTDGFKQITHNQVTLQAEGGLLVTHGKETDFCESLTVEADHDWFETGSILVVPKETESKISITSISRNVGVPEYRGSIELFSTAEGVGIVNELLLEEYLCAVVPSEMPVTYHMEALKAQAVCARSYAQRQIEEMAYPQFLANVDDSVSFQVYNNSKEQEASTKAVEETAGLLLQYKDTVAATYFYSTSSGHSTSVEAWGTDIGENNQYLKGVPIVDEKGEAYEKDISWFQWQTEIDYVTLENQLELYLKKEIGEIQNVEIAERGVGNIVAKLVVTGSENCAVLENENVIRDALGFEGNAVLRQDGKTVCDMELLPSAFFTLEKSEKGIIIDGSGYGHGIGMSQNGANELAKAGKTYKEILEYFFPGTKVE